uniref:Uncharacterized protein n=1 Tax=Magallana gigas TaxID=29159 RepID=A0A8W8MJR0_MAGGI
MAEAFLEFLDATNSANSFNEFEEMWLKMGEELELEVLPKGCTPPPPSPDYHSTLSTFGTKNESLKRPLSPTPESDTFSPVASYSPALDSCSAFTPVTRTISQAEDSILTTLRRTNQDKIQKLEKRMKEKTQEDVLLEQGYEEKTARLALWGEIANFKSPNTSVEEMFNISWSALKKDEKNPKTWTLNESRWFDNKTACIKDFREVTRNGYDFADSWGTKEILLKRRVMPQ